MEIAWSLLGVLVQFTVQINLTLTSDRNEALCRLSDSGKLCKDNNSDLNCTVCVQEGEEGKEEEEKENFGKLEYTLDYNFTDNQVSAYSLVKYTFQTYSHKQTFQKRPLK